MQEIIFGNSKNSKNTSYKAFNEVNKFIAPQVESHLIDQVGDLCNAAGKTLSKTGGRYGKLFKAAGSIVKITGTSGKIVLQSASKVSKLPVTPAAGIALHLSQIEKLHDAPSTKYTNLITNGVSLVKDIIETAGILCLQATQSLFEVLFTSESEEDLIGIDIYNIHNNSTDCENESITIAGHINAEQFFDMYSL